MLKINSNENKIQKLSAPIHLAKTMNTNDSSTTAKHSIFDLNRDDFSVS